MSTPDSLRATRRATAALAPDPVPPRVWELDVGALAGGLAAPSPRTWRSSQPALDRVGRRSGSALALALLYEAAERNPSAPAPLVIAVGECVRRGLPTAARASISSRAPLTGRLAEGQVGSDLGRRLASVTDALVLRGRTDVAGAVLHVASDGTPAIVACPELVGLGPARAHAALEGRFGACATLSIGIAGERGSPAASLAAGGDPPHFVGRGGLGAVLGGLGLKALAISAEAVSATPDAALVRALVSSPRLESRAEGGTLELFAALSARGELRLGLEGERATDAQAAAIARELATSRATRHGCSGCPTPCGWVFSRSSGEPAGGARFGATYALGLALGLERFEDSLALLARCDELAIDAKEVGAGLALLCLARERGILAGAPARGDLGQLLRWLDELERGSGDGARLARGASAIARELGLEPLGVASDGGAMRSDVDLATLLGQCASARGADPMRTFPFLASEGGDIARLRALAHPLPIRAGAEDPRNPLDKGRLVWWHENLSAALDATGFCAFSAAALLSDGVCTLDELARWIAPRDLLAEPGDAGAGERLLAMGEMLGVLQRRLDALWGAKPREIPAWARERLDRRGMWDEYRALRGLDERGALEGAAWQRFERGEPRNVALVLASADGEPAPPPNSSTDDREGLASARAGRVRMRASGALARALGAERELSLALPASLERVLHAAASETPAARDVLWKSGRPLPAVYRAGRRLALADAVEDGDVLDLVLVISGGAG